MRPSTIKFSSAMRATARRTICDYIDQHLTGDTLSPEALVRLFRMSRATLSDGRVVESTDNLIALANSVSRTQPGRELDMLLTAGERISMALLAIAISTHGYEARSFTGSQAGVITDSHHGRARIIDVTPAGARSLGFSGLTQVSIERVNQ